MLFIVNLLRKTDSTVICIPCMHEHVFYEPFSLKNCRFGRYLCELVDFCVLLSDIHVSKTRFKQINETLKTKRLCTHVLGTCVRNFIPLSS